MFWLAKSTVPAAPETGQPKALSCWCVWGRGLLVGSLSELGWEAGRVLGKKCCGFVPKTLGKSRLWKACEVYPAYFSVDLDSFHSKGNSPRRTGSQDWKPSALWVSVVNFGGKPVSTNTFRNVYASIFFFLICRKKIAWLP